MSLTEKLNRLVAEVRAAKATTKTPVKRMPSKVKVNGNDVPVWLVDQSVWVERVSKVVFSVDLKRGIIAVQDFKTTAPTLTEYLVKYNTMRKRSYVLEKTKGGLKVTPKGLQEVDLLRKAWEALRDDLKSAKGIDVKASDIKLSKHLKKLLDLDDAFGLDTTQSEAKLLSSLSGARTVTAGQVDKLKALVDKRIAGLPTLEASAQRHRLKAAVSNIKQDITDLRMASYLALEQ